MQRRHADEFYYIIGIRLLWVWGSSKVFFFLFKWFLVYTPHFYFGLHYGFNISNESLAPGFLGTTYLSTRVLEVVVFLKLKA